MGVQKGFLRGHPGHKPPTPLITRRKLSNAEPLVGKNLLCPHIRPLRSDLIVYDFNSLIHTRDPPSLRSLQAAGLTRATSTKMLVARRRPE